MTIDLSGEWRLVLDRTGACSASQEQPGQAVKLPGSLQQQGFGDPITMETPWAGLIRNADFFDHPSYECYRRPGQVKVPMWLQPERYYTGVAWYERDVEVPAAAGGKLARLTLERAHWVTQAWWDGTPLGERDSLCVPHAYELGRLTAGTHRLKIRVDNRISLPVGRDAHSVSDHTQTNWNGIVGSVGITTRDDAWIDAVHATPLVTQRAVKLRVRVTAVRAVSATVSSMGQRQEAVMRAGETRVIELVCALGETAGLWDTSTPTLHRVAVVLSGEGVSDRRDLRIGLREIAVKGTQFTLNGRPLFVRGTLECAVFPKTGYPATDIESWRRIVRQCKAHGLNVLRFHSWCPPEAAFDAADELGLYLQIEGPAWAQVGDGEPLDAFLIEESKRIIDCYGNHPSFVFMAYGNEPSGPAHKEYLAGWTETMKAYDGRRLYTCASGWPEIAESQFHVTPTPRIQRWGDELNSRINGLPPETCTDYREFVARYPTQPVISHEIGEWCVFPNFDEIAKYDGCFLKARNHEIFRDLLEAAQMGDQAGAFLKASGYLQLLCYKEEIESALRTPGFGGFHLLGLNDFPGQGTALVGCIDAHWDDKPYVTPELFRRFCSDTVVLARMPRRILSTGETFVAALEVAHYGPQPIGAARIVWRIERDDGEIIAQGRTEPVDLTGGLHAVGMVSLTLPPIDKPVALRLRALIEGLGHENDWGVWVFPAADGKTGGDGDAALVVRSADELRAALRGDGIVGSGGRHARLILLDPPAVENHGVNPGFSSIFWNTVWTIDDEHPKGQAPHTLGHVCDPAHPALAGFPTAGHSDWQWWELYQGAAVMVVDELPPGLRPIVQPIHTWFESRRLAFVLEAKIDGVPVVLCSMDLSSDLKNRPAARAMRASLAAYVASGACVPRHALTLDQAARLLKPTLAGPSDRQALKA